LHSENGLVLVDTRTNCAAEGGDAELTDREMLAQGRHTTVKLLPKYTKRTTRQIVNGAKKRRAARTKDGHLSE
jgi:hypothetical protein